MTAPTRGVGVERPSTHAERMADPAYAAHVRAIAAQAPPATAEEIRTVRGLFQAGRREAANVTPTAAAGAA